MNPFEEKLKHLRQDMVKVQLSGRDIRDEKVLSIFGKVPRHRFVDMDAQQDAYGDFPLSIGNGQTISQPYIVALMAQLMDIRGHDQVLEIGTGSGYETAMLAELAKSVFSIERIEGLSKKAKIILEELGYKNIHLKVGDGTLGWQEFAPFDKIAVTASSSEIPNPLLTQLSPNGKMVIPIGSRFRQRLVLLEKDESGRVSQKDICGCVFVALVGRYGWADAGKNP